MTATIQNDPFITTARTQVQLFWQAYLNLLGMQAQWNALNYGTTLMDGQGSNAGVTAAAVGSAVFDSMNAIQTVLTQGYATDLAKLL